MKDTEQKLNLVQKLAKIRSISGAVAKNKQGYNYSYAEITQILAKVTAGMKNYGVSLIPGIVPGTTGVEQKTIVTTKTDKTGKHFDQTTTEFLVCAEITFTWVDDDNPEDKIVVPWTVIGEQGDPSQAFGSGLTYCTRYFLTSYFQIAQDNDVDAYRSKQKEAEKAEDAEIAAGIIESFDKAVRSFLNDHPDRAEAVKTLAGKYIKGGNYKKIDDPELAAKLLSEFKEQFLKESQE